MLRRTDLIIISLDLLVRPPYSLCAKLALDVFSEDYKHVKLSSAGLVYKYFGKEILTTVLDNWSVTHDDDMIQRIYRKVYRNFILEIDAIDNGVSQYPSDVLPAYVISTNLSARIGRYNPEWNSEKYDPGENFKKAMDVVEDEFLWNIHSMARVFMPARIIVEEAFKKRKEFHESGLLMFLNKTCPWKSHVYDLEKENEVQG
jgi:uncharacterized UPF0160 family protein